MDVIVEKWGEGSDEVVVFPEGWSVDIEHYSWVDLGYVYREKSCVYRDENGVERRRTRPYDCHRVKITPEKARVETLLEKFVAWMS